MKILKGFGVENYRVFKEYCAFNLKPITILTGPNNSGKSSLIKALLMLKENLYRKKNYILYGGKLNFNNEIHKLSSFKNAINNPEKEMVFSLKFGNFYIKYTFNNDQSLTHDYEFRTNENKLVIKQNGGDLRINLLNFADFLVDFDSISGADSNSITSANKDANSFISDIKSYVREKSEFIAIFIDDIDQKLKISYTTNPKFEGNFDQYKLIKHTNSLYGHGIDNIDLIPEITLNYLFSDLLNFGSVKLDFIKSLLNFFSSLPNIHYLPLSQINPKRSYSGNEPLGRILKNKKYIDENPSSGSANDWFTSNLRDQKIKGMNDFLSSWINKFGIEELDYDYLPDYGRYYLRINDKSLIDHGHGYSKIVAIFLLLSNSKSFSNGRPIIILEEPEINLHPNFQSKLAEFIVEAQKQYNYQFIIETHSEYFILELQNLTAKEKIKPEDSVIYYFHNPDNIPNGEEQVKMINISVDGRLTGEFGSGFYDESTRLMMSLFTDEKMN